MRNLIIKGLLLSGVVVAMTGCDDNAWNDKLDGFDGNEPITDVKTIEYTLTAADYAAIASNSTNVSLAGGDLSAALKAVGTQGYFTEQISPSKFVPAFLASTSFPYFTLSDGSAIKLTYNTAVGIPEEVSKLAAAGDYVVSDADYIYAWGSDENYIDAFTPSVKASKYIPEFLSDSYDDALAGDYVIVTYEYAEQEPIFGNVGGGTPDVPSFEMSSVIGSVSLDETVSINGIVTAVCSRGFILSDNTGSILVYFGSSYDGSYNIGDQLVMSAPISSYGKGFQIAGGDAEIEVVGNQAVTYPAPKLLTGADFDKIATRTDNELAVYAQFTGTVSINGNYVNFIIEGAENAQGSAYYITDDLKAQLVDGQLMTINGYLTAVSSGRYCNFVITSAKAASRANAPVVPVPTTNTNAVYYYNGSKWSEAKGVAILQPSDYIAMGQSYGNLSNDLPAQLLPIYLANKYPYAQADDAIYVLYKYYASSVTSYRCDQYVYDGSAWTLNKGVETETAQFVKSHGVWNYDPSVTITLPAGRSQPLSTTYYQACVNWVFENVDKPLGSTDIKSGKYYITSYGNNEYYSGTSAYQGNVDLRPSAALTQYPAGYEGMSDTEIVELMKQRFAYQVMPGALGVLHADAVPVDGIDVIYTINFAIYTGSTSEYTIVYRVVAPGKFEFVQCDWWEGGLPAEKLDLSKYMK